MAVMTDDNARWAESRIEKLTAEMIAHCGSPAATRLPLVAWLARDPEYNVYQGDDGLTAEEYEAHERRLEDLAGEACRRLKAPRA